MKDPKRFSTLQARAALLGIQLLPLRLDADAWGYVAMADGLAHELADLEAVERWLDGRPVPMEASGAA